MGTKKNTIISIALFSLIMVYGTCNKKWNCAEVNHSFECPIQIYPDFDSIKINDTLWIELNSPKILKDIISGEAIDYSNASNLGSAITIVALKGAGTSSNSNVMPSVDSFEYKLIMGRQIQRTSLQNQIVEYIFFESQNTYNFKLGIIAKKKGIYAIGIGNAANVYTKNDPCRKARFLFKLINTNNHIYYLEQAIPGYVPSGLDLTNTYYFKVK